MQTAFFTFSPFNRLVFWALFADFVKIWLDRLHALSSSNFNFKTPKIISKYCALLFRLQILPTETCTFKMRNLVFHLCLLMEKGLELCSALQLSKRVQVQGEATPKQKSFLLYPPFSFSWEVEVVSTYGLLAAASAATQKPPPTPLHVRSCCTACRPKFGAIAPQN